MCTPWLQADPSAVPGQQTVMLHLPTRPVQNVNAQTVRFRPPSQQQPDVAAGASSHLRLLPPSSHASNYLRQTTSVKGQPSPTRFGRRAPTLALAATARRCQGWSDPDRIPPTTSLPSAANQADRGQFPHRPRAAIGSRRELHCYAVASRGWDVRLRQRCLSPRAYLPACLPAW